jgi:hypothetical protein
LVVVDPTPEAEGASCTHIPVFRRFPLVFQRVGLLWAFRQVGSGDFSLPFGTMSANPHNIGTSMLDVFTSRKGYGFY